MKKLLAFILAMVLVLGLAVTAFAADDDEPTTYTITMETTTGHTYTAYQVFAGELSTKTVGEGDDATEVTVLSNITWGADVKGDGSAIIHNLQHDVNPILIDPATGENYFADCTTAKEVAEVLAELTDDSEILREVARVFADGVDHSKGKSSVVEGDSIVIKDLAAGYYLIIDDTEEMAYGESYSDLILRVVEDVNVKAKDGDVTIEKKVKDVNDTTGEETDWQDSADHDKYDKPEYRITGTLPASYDRYVSFYYNFHDELAGGLQYTANNAVIRLYENAAAVEADTDKTGGVDITSAFTETVTGSTGPGTNKTVIDWTCEDLKAIEDVTITKDSVIVVYYTAQLISSNWSSVADYYNPNTAHIDYSNDPNLNSHGRTVDDKVTVFNFILHIDKYADEVKEGNELPGAAFTLFKKIDGEWKKWDSTNAGDWSEFLFFGLDDGDYRLEETTTPVGYNTIDPIEFRVVAVHDVESDDPKLTRLEIQDMDGNLLNAVVLGKNGTTYEGEGNFNLIINHQAIIDLDIVNKPGAVLPTTGGNGTILIYVIGGLMVAIAVVVLIARRKKEATK
ncbi:MAG: LPXTG cell wall anchor domain-containing protein [Lachnospiraceae bacterium]|nr:LPXTG cell wall anchor domain-containing protein [Lachnospiraceae bacterium]